MRRAGTRFNGPQSSIRDLVMRMRGRRSSRSLRQDELSSPGVTQPIDFAVVLDLHHGAGSEQFGAWNSSHFRIERDARCRDRGRRDAVKEFRVRSGIVRPAHVHLRVAETGAPVSEGRMVSTWIGIQKQFVIVAPIRSGKPERSGIDPIQSIMRIILISSDVIVNPVSCMKPACVPPPVLPRGSGRRV